jgi:imidazolonepropionase
VENVKRFILSGVQTLEMKSGYGLDTDNEFKILTAIDKLRETFKPYISIVPTFLGAHAFPPEYKGKEDEYVDLIINDMLPKCADMATFCDVFCENGYFSVKQAKRILTAAKKHGLHKRIHADEFVDSGAAKLACSVNAVSADHLMAISDEAIEAMSKNGKVIATILPGTTVFLGKPGFAPARKLIDSNIRVAIGSDFNPGSCAYQSQTLMMNFAM